MNTDRKGEKYKKVKNDEMMKTLERKNEGGKESLLSLFRKTKILLHMKFF